jgi:DNA-binding NarL/FixJ family response regulator
VSRWQDDQPIRVLLADDEAGVREALEDLVAFTPQLELVGSVADAESAVELAAQVQPDVALVDMRMPRGGGPHAALGIGQRCPETRVIGFSAYDDPTSLSAMLEAGATGYLVKGAPNKDIVEALHTAGLEARRAKSADAL